MVIGITGYIGSGKSVVSKYLCKKISALYLPTDDISKKLLIEDCNLKNDIKALEKQYGEIDFSKMTENNILRKKLNNLIHNKVWEYVRNIISTNKNVNYVVETALPSEIFFQIIDYCIYVVCDKKNRCNRIKNNRNIEDSIVNKIFEAQKEYEMFYEKCDIKLENNLDIIDIERKIDEICKLRKWE